MEGKCRSARSETDQELAQTSIEKRTNQALILVGAVADASGIRYPPLPNRRPVSTSTGVTALAIRFEPPLLQCVSNDFFLIGKCAEKMNMFYLAFCIDNDSHRNGIESMLGEDWVNSGK